MGLFDLLSKESREKSALEKNLKRVLNKHAQSEDRFAAMEALRKNGSDEAIYGLARRFSFNYDKTIADEQEKEWAYETLVSLGDKAIAPVSRFAMGSESVSWPLRVLDKVTGREKFLAILDELIAKEEPGYTRDPSRKIQILNWLAEWKAEDAGGDEAARRLVPYLADFDETVRFTAVDALSHQRHEGIARGPLLDALLRPEEESRRIKVKIADLLADAGWSVGDRKDDVAKVVAAQLPEFALANDRLTKK
jgi:HEAT repeat protein